MKKLLNILEMDNLTESQIENKQDEFLVKMNKAISIIEKYTSKKFVWPEFKLVELVIMDKLDYLIGVGGRTVLLQHAYPNYVYKVETPKRKPLSTIRSPALLQKYLSKVVEYALVESFDLTNDFGTMYGNVYKSTPGESKVKNRTTGYLHSKILGFFDGVLLEFALHRMCCLPIAYRFRKDMRAKAK